jgi:hypothetical protein
VELIKLAVFIGDIAVGRWMPWDQIESPPGEVLSRHQLSHLAPLIEQTRADLGRVADSHKSLSGPAGCGPSAKIQGDHTLRVRYSDLSDSDGDWMPLLLASLGIEIIRHPIGSGEMLGGMLVNCVNEHPRDVLGAVRRNDWDNLKPLFLIERHAPSGIEEYGTTTRFPTSVAALRASCEQLATSVRLPKTQNALAPSEIPVS